MRLSVLKRTQDSLIWLLGKKIHAQITSRGNEIRYLEQQFWCQNHSVRISHSTAFINFLRRSQVVKDVAL